MEWSMLGFGSLLWKKFEKLEEPECSGNEHLYTSLLWLLTTKVYQWSLIDHLTSFYQSLSATNLISIISNVVICLQRFGAQEES